MPTQHRAFNFGQFVNGKADQPLPDSIAPYESQINDFCKCGRRAHDHFHFCQPHNTNNNCAPPS